MITFGNVKPELTKAVGNGTFEVYFDAKEVERETHMDGEDATTEKVWQYDIVTVPTLDYASIVSAIVRERYSSDDVQAIIANKAVADNTTSVITDSKRSEYLSDYADYQSWREHAKEIASEVAGKTAADSLELAKISKIAEAHAHYNAVGYTATYHGIELKLDYETRAKLRNRLEAEEQNGIETTTVWYNGNSFNLPISSTKTMLTALEVYASKCFDAHNQHINAIGKLADIDAVEDYDVTTGYPQALTFD